MPTILIDDYEIYYEELGKGQPILFLHGAYLSLNEWKFQTPQELDLDEDLFRCIYIDLPGHGKSTPLKKDVSIEHLSEIVLNFQKCLGLEKAIWCGHSLGGMVALSCATNNPQNLNGLALVDTSYGIKSSKWESLLTNLSKPILYKYPIEKQAVIYAKQLSKHNKESYKYIFDEISKYVDDKEGYFRIWDAISEFGVKNQLNNISCPTLILVGEKNKQTHNQAKYMNKIIKDSVLFFISSAGHMVNMDNSTEFNQKLKDFIVSVSKLFHR
jgi:pimeloyl-ACP methyl ester carboxylesterase